MLGQQREKVMLWFLSCILSWRQGLWRKNHGVLELGGTRADFLDSVSRPSRPPSVRVAPLVFVSCNENLCKSLRKGFHC